MNFLLDMALGQLDLTDAERATVEKALPDVKAVVDSLNAALPDLQDGNQFYVHSQNLILRLFTDYGKIGPSVSALLGDGWVDIPNVMSAANDAKNAVESDPKTTQHGQELYNKLQPVVIGAYKKWPAIEPAVDVIIAALKRKKLSPQMALGALLQKP